MRGWGSFDSTARGKHDHTPAGSNGAVLKMSLHGARQYNSLNISSDSRQLFNGGFVTDAFNVLFNDGTFIQVHRCVVSRRADHFHTAIVGLQVGVGALECREKRVM